MRLGVLNRSFACLVKPTGTVDLMIIIASGLTAITSLITASTLLVSK